MAAPFLESLPVRAQSSMPVVGFLHAGSRAAYDRYVNAFKAGLQEGGFIEGRNVAIEYRFAEGRSENLAPLAQDLIRRRVKLIATGGAEVPVFAAKAAAEQEQIPVTFVIGGDPVKLGIVPSLARPAGHVTGISMFTSTLENKRFGLLHEVVPTAKSIAVLIDPSGAAAQTQLAEVTEAAAQSGVRIVVIRASRETEFAPAVAGAVAQGANALQICASPFFLAKREALVALAASHRIPAMYEWREFTEAGGLMSYGTDLADAYRQNGGYAAKILKGSKPADLPVMQVTKFEFVINPKTAKTLGFEFAPTVLARADAVIE
jgi:putative ABC transport system substrate-binding protein